MSDSELLALARKGLEEASRQLLAEGAPIEPYLLDQSLYGCALYDKKGGTDPLILAKAALPVSLPAVERCVLLFDSLVEFKDGKLANALVAMACDRHGQQGVALAQRYTPKRWFRSLRVVGEPQPLPPCPNFVRAAFANEPIEHASLAKLSPREEAELDRQADAVVDYFAAQFPPSNRYRAVDAADFTHLDLDWYDAIRESFDALGFRHLQDVEIESLTENNRAVWLPTMVRRMLSADGQVCASAWQLKTTQIGRAFRSNPAPTADLETEFEDGTCIRTSNGAPPGHPNPDWLMDAWLPSGSPPAALLALHRSRVEAYSKSSGTIPRLVSDKEEFLAFMQRQHARLSEFRGSAEGLGAGHLSQAARGDARLLARIHEKLAARRALRE